MVCVLAFKAQSSWYVILIKIRPIQVWTRVKLSLRMTTKAWMPNMASYKNTSFWTRILVLLCSVSFLSVIKLPGKQNHNHKALKSFMMKTVTIRGSRALVFAWVECSILVGKHVWEAGKSCGLNWEGFGNLDIEGIECLMTLSYFSQIYSLSSG